MFSAPINQNAVDGIGKGHGFKHGVTDAGILKKVRRFLGEGCPTSDSLKSVEALSKGLVFEVGDSVFSVIH